MSDDMNLIDLRAKVTETTNQVLEAHARHRNRDKSEIVREILHDWALSEIDKSSLVQRLTRRDGNGTASGGRS